ncbi:GGDEF domain-containing protein [bacterium]|nr:MAG: GGDEF domain-containing protein [bacterium]
MICLVLVSLLSLGSFIAFKIISRNNLRVLEDDFDGVSKEYEYLLNESKRLHQQNADLRNILDRNIALYDITKEICKSLDMDEVFNNFLDQIRKYVVLSDCKFIKADMDMVPYMNYSSLPLKINRSVIGHLMVDGLREEDKDKFGILAQQFILGLKRAVLYQRIQELAITDSLTGVHTRKHYLSRLEEEINYSKKTNQSFSFLMLDIDHFKKYNDLYGHLVGDAILKQVSKIIKDSLRQVDSVGRYGGEEFSVVLTQTDKNGAKFAAERIRQSVEEKIINVYDEELKVTISIGVSIFPEDSKDSQGLIEAGDAALYQAKQTGRNRVCFA